MVRCSCLRVSSVLTRVGVCTRWIAAAAAQALMLVVDKNVSLTLTGMGDVIEPAADGIIGRNCTASSVLYVVTFTLCHSHRVQPLDRAAALPTVGAKRVALRVARRPSLVLTHVWCCHFHSGRQSVD